jgi:hypothetical protein
LIIIIIERIFSPLFQRRTRLRLKIPCSFHCSGSNTTQLAVEIFVRILE